RNDLDLVLANAMAYLEMLGHLVIAWIWLRQALTAQRALIKAHADDADFYRGKLQACQFFFRYELPKTAAQNELLRRLDPTCLDMRDEWF
ncbi:MAG: acyl-CoA dehydrogenase C-terminal domain-containing protein, partial [Pseudomonadota bacterium]